MKFQAQKSGRIITTFEKFKIFLTPQTTQNGAGTIRDRIRTMNSGPNSENEVYNEVRLSSRSNGETCEALQSIF